MKFSDIQKAIEFVNSDPSRCSAAAYRKDTGQLLFRTKGGEDGIGPVVASDPNYTFMPDKRDLGLGRGAVI